MSAISKLCRGQHLFSKLADVSRWYPAPTVAAAHVEIWAVDVDKPTTFQHAKLIARVAPGQQNIAIDYNPAKDRYKEFRAVTISAAGVPNVRYLDDAPGVTALFSRQDPVADAGVISQAYNTSSYVQVDVTGFSSFVVARQVQRATNSAFTGGSIIDDYVVEGGAAKAASLTFIRFVSPGDPAEFQYVRVRHSNTDASSGWTNWSNTLEIEFLEEPSV